MSKRELSNIRPFHIAFPVANLDETIAFYCGLLGGKMGRRTANWVDIDLGGHQLSAHISEHSTTSASGNVDNKVVPIPHWGIILEWQHWQELREKIANSDFSFHLEPTIRFEGQAGEQATFFVFDPSGNALEFKAFKNDNQIFEI